MCFTFTATRYLPPFTPHVGPLDPVTFNEAALFTCIQVHWTHEWHNASLFLAAHLYCVYGSFRPTRGLDYPKT